MPCYAPLRAYGLPSLDGKLKIKFCSNEFEKMNYDNSNSDKKLLIPCGQCIGCRLEYSRQWAIRCVLESKKYRDNYFVTLTYDDEHLPVQNNFVPDVETGELDSIFISHPLVKNDLRKFIKDLRRYYDYHFNHIGIRFFACGEYGSKNNRPHYHVIFFNLPIFDLVKDKELSKSGCTQFSSDSLSRIWDRGRLSVSEVNFQTCAYTARYCTKKLNGTAKSFYDENGLCPEFSLCSRRPGIAADYYYDHVDDIYKNDNIVLHGSDQPIISKPPKYFDRLYDIDYSENLIELKKKRRDSASKRVNFMLLNTSKNQFEALADQGFVKKSKIKACKREIF